MSASRKNVEARIQRLSGYPSLAHFIASDRVRTTLIYKRFDELAARNLLYLQSELAELEAKQHGFDQHDLTADLDTKQCARSFTRLQKAVQANDTRQRESDGSTLATLPRPSKRVLKAFRTEFDNEEGGKSGSFPTLGGNSAGLYDDIDDLVALRVHVDQDRLTTFAQEHLAFLFPDRKRSRHGIAYASDRAISSFIAWFSTFLAALLLIGAIVVLYKVTSPDWRLGLIATFTTMFAGSVGLLTNARRAELFAATAAYAAVLVVFVSGDLGNSQSSTAPSG